jgi:hypothetical protein
MFYKLIHTVNEWFSRFSYYQNAHYIKHFRICNSISRFLRICNSISRFLRICNSINRFLCSENSINRLLRSENSIKRLLHWRSSISRFLRSDKSISRLFRFAIKLEVDVDLERRSFNRLLRDLDSESHYLAIDIVRFCFCRIIRWFIFFFVNDIENNEFLFFQSTTERSENKRNSLLKVNISWFSN